MQIVKPKIFNKEIIYNGISYKTKFYNHLLSFKNILVENYPEWDNSIEYQIGDFVKLSNINKIFRAIQNNVDTFPLADGKVWMDYGAINPYRMLIADEFFDQKTVGENIEVEFGFSFVDTIIGLDMKFNKCILEVKDLDRDLIIEKYEISGMDIGCSNFGEYFYSDKKNKNRLIKQNLPYLVNGSIKLKFEGYVEIGKIIIGLTEEFGLTLFGTNLKVESNSKIEVNERKERKILRRGNTRVVEAKVIYEQRLYNEIIKKIREILDENIVWIPAKNENLSEMLTLGYIEDFQIPLDNSINIDTTITIIGVI